MPFASSVVLYLTFRKSVILCTESNHWIYLEGSSNMLNCDDLYCSLDGPN